MINITINHQKLTVSSGSTIIEIADQFKIPIPRLCHHQELTVTAHCGLCQVEILNPSRILTACNTPVTSGMEIITNSNKILNIRQQILENLLKAHPIECPTCEKAGECALQDLYMQYGSKNNILSKPPNQVTTCNLGSLISTRMNRCIGCKICVRFTEEIAGSKAITLTSSNNGYQLINNQDLVTSELLTNIIDLCPTGALIATPLKYNEKPWELYQRSGISSHDCIGSNIHYHVNLAGEIKRAVPMPNPNINQMWLCNRDRFGFLGLNSQDRLKYPLIKKQQKWYIGSWSEAFELIKFKIQQLIAKYGSNQIGGIISPNATTEEGFWFQYILKKLGSYNIDHRLHQIDFHSSTNTSYPYLNLTKISQLQSQEVILLIGSKINAEQPIASMYIRQATQNNCKVIVINPCKLDFDFSTYAQLIPKRANLLTKLLQIIKAIQIKYQLDQTTLLELTKDLSCDPIDLEIAEIFKHASPHKITILLGDLAISHPKYSMLDQAAKWIANVCKANLGYLAYGANSLGLSIINCLPFSENLATPPAPGATACTNLGANIGEMLQSPLKGYFLFGIEPELDCAHGVYANQTLSQAEFIIGFSAFESESLFKYAHVLLPIGTPHETGGSYINLTGEYQAFSPIAKMPGNAQSGSNILKNLIQCLDLHMDHINLTTEIHTRLTAFRSKPPPKLSNLDHIDLDPSKPIGLIRIAPFGMYSIDPIIRRVKAFQENTLDLLEILINPIDANHLNLKDHDLVTLSPSINYQLHHIDLKITINHQIPMGCMLLEQKNLQTLISLPYEPIIIEKINTRTTQELI